MCAKETCCKTPLQCRYRFSGRNRRPMTIGPTGRSLHVELLHATLEQQPILADDETLTFSTCGRGASSQTRRASATEQCRMLIPRCYAIAGPCRRVSEIARVNGVSRGRPLRRQQEAAEGMSTAISKRRVRGNKTTRRAGKHGREGKAGAKRRRSKRNRFQCIEGAEGPFRLAGFVATCDDSLARDVAPLPQAAAFRWLMGGPWKACRSITLLTL